MQSIFTCQNFFDALPYQVEGEGHGEDEAGVVPTAR